MLVEEDLRHGIRGLGVLVDATSALQKIFVGCRAQVRAEAAGTRMAEAVELAIGLDNRGAEAHSHPIGHLDDDTHLMAQSPPPLAAPVEMPRAGHAQVRVQHEAVVPHDLEVLAARLDSFYDAPGTGVRPVQTRCIEARR